jgi:hypothetical protein
MGALYANITESNIFRADPKFQIQVQDSQTVIYVSAVIESTAQSVPGEAF